MPFTIPESYLAYCTNREVRTAVDHILESKTPGVPADLEWNDLPEFHSAVLSAHQVRCKFAIFLHELWNEVWQPVVDERKFNPRTVADTQRLWKRNFNIGTYTIWTQKFFARVFDIDDTMYVLELGTRADTQNVGLSLYLWNNNDNNIYTTKLDLGDLWSHKNFVNVGVYAYSSKKLAPIVDGGNIDLAPLRKIADDALTAVESFCQSD